MSEIRNLTDAANRGDLDIVREIVEKHPDLVHQRNEDGATALHYAAFGAHRTVAQFLVERGADVNARDTVFGATPAGWAIEYLREIGGFLGIELDDFAYALKRGDVDWLSRLLKRFPGLREAGDGHGDSFRQLAERSGNLEIQKLFADGDNGQSSEQK